MPKSRTYMHPAVTDGQIRHLLRSRLKAESDVCVLIEELAVDGGAARIDIAVAGPRLAGYEIKGDADSFARMPNQIHAYNRVFDEIWIVVGSALLEEAKAVVPSWWGILSVRPSNEEFALDLVRPAAANCCQESYSVASLLDASEAAAMLTEVAHKVPKKASRRVLWEKVAATFSIDQIKAAVLASYSQRHSYRLPIV